MAKEIDFIIMKLLLKFILIGLLFAAFPGEIANQIIVHKTLWGFASTMLIYSVLLFFGYFISKLFKRKLALTLLYFVLFGIIGLLIEYFIIGQGPEAYASGMFTFWAFLFTLPRIFTPLENAADLPVRQAGEVGGKKVWGLGDVGGLMPPSSLTGFIDDSSQFEGWKKRVLKYWLISSPIVLIVFLIPPLDVGMYLGIHALMVQLVGFYVFFFFYLKQLYYSHRTSRKPRVEARGGMLQIPEGK